MISNMNLRYLRGKRRGAKPKGVFLKGKFKRVTECFFQPGNLWLVFSAADETDEGFSTVDDKKPLFAFWGKSIENLVLCVKPNLIS